MYLLNTFGGLTLVNAATREMVGAPRRKPLALLALVAAAGERGAERDWLATMLWPEVDELHARRALSQTVYSLRRELGVDALQSGPRLTIDPATLTSDAAEFAASAGPGRSRDDLERAAALYAGPYLDGVQFPGCTEFDQWAARERAVHAASYQGVLRELARSAAESGDMPGSVRWLERAAREFPLDSDVALALARGYADVGRRGQAAAFLDAHCADLRAEGIDPPLSVEALRRELQAAIVETSRGVAASQHGRGDVAASRSTTAPGQPENPDQARRALADAIRLQAEKSSRDRWRYVAGAAGAAVAVVMAVWVLRPGAGVLDSLPAAFSAEVTRPARAGAGGEMLLDVRAVSLGPDSAPTALTQYVDDVLRKRLAVSAKLVPLERVRALRDSLVRVRGDRHGLRYTGWEMLEGSRAPLALEVSVVYLGPRSDSVSMMVSLFRKAAVPPCPPEWRHLPSKTDLGGIVDGYESWSSFRVKAPTRAPTRYVDSLVRSAARMVESMRTCDLEAHRGVTTSPWCWAEPNRVGVVPGVVRARIAAGEDIHMMMMSKQLPNGGARYCRYSSREAFGN
jgi:DNA-binding SARP family transcriptional activator